MLDMEAALQGGGSPSAMPAPLFVLLSLLDREDARSFLEAAPRCLAHAQRLRWRFQHQSARLALSAWCARHVYLRFESYYQEKEARTVARSRDPRVPPHVFPYWAERGKVAGSRMLLRPCELPRIRRDSVVLRFNGGEQAARRPMLTSVVQTNRRIYSVLSLVVLKGDSDAEAATTDEDQDGDVLRTYTYVTEFHEFETRTPVDKRALDASGARCRHDLVSLDGSVALELDVPVGADAQVDYFLVKQSVVTMHMQELLQRSFSRLRPIAELPAPSAVRQPCSIQVSFRRLDGQTLGSHRLAGELTVEAQEDGEVAGRRARAGTGMEAFEIVTCSVVKPVDPQLALPLPSEPGYCFLDVRDPSSGRLFFYAAVLHRGAQREGMHSALNLRWLPGMLETYPTPDARHRRALKGQMHISTHLGSDLLHELSIVAQHLPVATLERYAASIHSYTRGRR